MDSNALLHFIPNLYLNAILSLFLSIALSECFIWMFRLKHPRLKYILRITPFLKLPLDLLLYHYSSWAFLEGFSIFHVEEGSRMISVGTGYSFYHWALIPFVYLSLSANYKNVFYFSFTDLLLEKAPLELPLILSIIFLLGSSFFLTKWFIHFYHTQKYIHFLTSHAYTLKWPKMKKKPLIYLSNEPHSPFITGLFRPKVFIPKQLFNQLSRSQKQALLAHEYSHARWIDIFFETTAEIILAVFWIIPFKRSLLQRMRFQRELGCDIKAIQKTKSSLPLLEALYQTAQFLKNKSLYQPKLILSFTEKPILKRANFLLNCPYRSKNRYLFIAACLLSIYLAVTLIKSPLGLF